MNGIEELEEVNPEETTNNDFMNEEPQEEEDEQVFIPSTQEPLTKPEHVPKYTTFARLVILSSIFLLLFIFSLVLIAVEIYFQTQNKIFDGYQVSNLKQTPNGMEANLIYLSTTSKQNSPYDADIPELTLQIFYETRTRVHVKILDKNNPKRWQGKHPFIQNIVPEDIIKSKTPAIAPTERDYTVEVKTPFGLMIKRKSNDEIIFDTTDLPLIYSNYYLSISTKLPENPNIYGLGERVYNFRLPENNKTYVMFNKDQLNVEYKNLYGTHPFYIEKRKHSSHGVFFFNSNAQEVNLHPRQLEYRTIGGILDFYIFTGSLPQEVVQQYHELIGKPVMIPYWSLGFHQCRWGYKNLNQTKEVVAGYKKHQIPLETMWNDIDYMDHYKLFTIDPINYPEIELRKFVDELHANDQHYMVIVDPGVKTEPGYEMYEEGLRDKLFITKSDGITPIVNKVWPGLTVFPDFTSNKSQSYWGKYIEKFYNQIPVDGLWLDMNEIVGFCDGECTTNKLKDSTKPDENHPPYMPSGDFIYHRTLLMDSRDSLSTQFNTHSLHAHYENKATRFHLDKILKKRSLILTRSSFAGTGHTSSKWLGDNYSSWEDMKKSISGILSMNLFGFPMIGADICGFLGNTNEELCIRWYQLGCYYPFSRNHNAFDSIPQEPWVFGESLINASRKAIREKYSILPYYYTQYYKIHVEGGSLIRSLALEFPFDLTNDINYIDTQFMIGPALLISPVLHPGVNSIIAYFPTGDFGGNVWYDFKTGIEVMNTGTYQNISAPLNHIPVHIRGGHIVVKQEPGMTIKQSRMNPFELVVASDGSLNAFGELFLDDGISLDSIESQKYTLIEYVLSPGNLKSNFNFQGFDVSHLTMNEISIFGAQNACEVWVNNQNFTNFEFDSTTTILKLHNLGLVMNLKFEITWNCFV